MKTRIFAKCVECGWVCSGFLFDREEGPEIVPIGVADCPGCGGGEFDRMSLGQVYGDRDRGPD